MSAEKKVFSRLFKEDKTELATQKIELALVDEIKKREKFLIKTLNQMDSLEADYLFIKKQIINISKLVESDAKLLDKDVSKAITTLKGLGVDTKEFTKYSKIISKARKEVSNIKSIT